MQYQISLKSQFGFLILRSNGESLTEVSFADDELQEQKQCEVLENCGNQLQRYFSGELMNFDLPLAPDGTEFQQRVWAELQKIPFGETITYMDLAVRLGDPKCIRAAGTANGKNPIAIIIPCHPGYSDW